MNRLRILLLVPDCNPEGVSMPYVTYSHAAALAQAHDIGPAESFRFFPAQGTYTLRDRSPQRWFALASRLQPAREPKGMGLQPAESVSISAFRSLHLSSRGSDHSRFVPNVFRVYQV